MVTKVYIEFRKKENGKKMKTEYGGKVFDYGDWVEPSDIGLSINEAEELSARSQGNIAIIRKSGEKMSLIERLRDGSAFKSPGRTLASTRGGRVGKVISGLSFPPGCVVEVKDAKYKFYGRDEVLAALRGLRRGTFEENCYDCDNFTEWSVASLRSNPADRRFKCLAIGDAWGRYAGGGEYHSLVVFWTDKNTRVYWEPQTGQMVDFHPKKIFV